MSLSVAAQPLSKLIEISPVVRSIPVTSNGLAPTPDVSPGVTAATVIVNWSLFGASPLFPLDRLTEFPAPYIVVVPGVASPLDLLAP